MSLKPADFQRVGLLAIVSQFVVNQHIEPSTRTALKKSLLAVLNDHPVNDSVEKQVKKIIK